MRKLRKLLIGAAILAAIGSVQAQPADDEEPTREVGKMGVEAELSPREMTQQTEERLQQMESVLRRVIELQTGAREQKDIIKLNCVNDKLLQVKQLLNIAESARNDMLVAITAGSSDAHDKYVQVTISKEKVTGLRAETEGCIGEEVVFLGPTKVDVTRPLIIDDPTKKKPFSIAYREGIVDGAGELKIERVVYATPFR